MQVLEFSSNKKNKNSIIYIFKNNIMAETKTKPYKEVLEKELYTNDYETTSESWKTYPTNRIKVQLVNYSWELKDYKWEIKSYQGQKVIITNSKLETEDWQNVIKKKVLKTSYWDKVVDDQTQVKLSPDEFTDLLNNFKKKTENA